MIDFTKPLQTNIPGEVAVPLNVKFAGRQLVQITEESGAQGLYLSTDDGHILRLSVSADFTVSPGGYALRNAPEAVDVPEIFINVYEDGSTGWEYRTLEEANRAARAQPQPLKRRACVGIKLLVNSNGLVHQSVRTFPV